MKTLYVEFTKSSKRFAPFSWLVSKVQGTEYSHVRLRWVNSTQTPIIYEASGSSVRFIGPMAGLNLSSKVIHRFSFELNHEQYKELVKICMTYAGVQYSIKQVINIGLNNLGIKWQPFRRDSEYAQVCSELVARVLQALGKEIDFDPDTAGPRELYNFLNRG